MSYSSTASVDKSVDKLRISRLNCVSMGFIERRQILIIAASPSLFAMTIPPRRLGQGGAKMRQFPHRNSSI